MPPDGLLQAVKQRPTGAGPRAAARAVLVALPLYIAAIVVAELLVAFVSALAGALTDAVILLALVNHHLLGGPAGDIRAPVDDVPDQTVGVLPALALVVLLRIASLCLPLSEIAPAYWHAVVGTPVLLAAGLAVRSADASWNGPGMFARDRRWRQVVFALVGLPLGVLGYAAFTPEPLASSGSGAQLAGATLGVFFFAGVLEEVIFRGLLQPALVRHVGRAGVVLAWALFCAAYLGTGSIGALAFFAAVGALFATWAQRTSTITGVAAAHGLLGVGLLVVWPLILG